MESRTLERSDLEGKVLAELQQIAQAVGVENHRMRKSDLIDAILAKASENGQDAAAVGMATAGDASGNGPAGTASEEGAATPPATDSAAPATTDTPPADASVATEGATTSAESAGGTQDGGTATVEGPRRQEGHGRTGVMERPRRPSREERRRQRELRREREREEREQELAEAPTRTGILDILPEGYGFLRTTGYLPGPEDVYVSLSQIRRFGLRRGDVIAGQVRQPRDNEKYPALLRIETVAEVDPETARRRPDFDKLTPLFPDERYRLEHDPKQVTERIIDLVAPVGKGQRGMVVSPPKAGKTTVLKQIAGGIIADDPKTHVMILLVDERPEEVTDWQRTVEAAEVVYSTFDKPADQHTQVTELVLERAKRLVEQGRDVAILLDSITRLARAYNLAAPASGRILSGGVDSTALYPPKRFFGAARNLEEGGSLTIIASALVETGSRMDEVIFEEFKGTGNWEIRLDRQLSEKRIFPALNIEASGTRKEERLLSTEELALVWRLRRVLHALEPAASLELLIDKIRQTKSNEQFLKEISKAPVGE
ncbi:MAG: transcription termination factor Rho [Actinomycetota bacterium]|nr:transcription termination factor Rho [Actinomycetota bacterium]